jgi:hypothetical protein
MVHPILLQGIQLKHGTVQQANNEASHLFGIALKQHFLNDLEVAELLNQPSSTLLVLIDVSLEKIQHSWDMSLYLCTLQYGEIAACRKFENSQL